MQISIMIDPDICLSNWNKTNGSRGLGPGSCLIYFKAFDADSLYSKTEMTRTPMAPIYRGWFEIMLSF